MHTSLEEGVNIINDISGFRRKDNINTILHNYKKNKNPIYIIIMHMQGYHQICKLIQNINLLQLIYLNI